MDVATTDAAAVATAAPTMPNAFTKRTSPTMFTTDAAATATAGVFVSKHAKQMDCATIPIMANGATAERICAYDNANRTNSGLDDDPANHVIKGRPKPKHTNVMRPPRAAATVST